MTSTPPSPPRSAPNAANPSSSTSSLQSPPTTSTPTPLPSSTQAPAEKPPAPPVNTLPTRPARIYSIIHPLALLALYTLRFGALVASPVETLLHDLPFLAVLQVAYVVVCLPPAGSVQSSSSSSNNSSLNLGSGASSSSASSSSDSASLGAGAASSSGSGSGSKSVTGSESDANSVGGDASGSGSGSATTTGVRGLKRAPSSNGPSGSGSGLVLKAGKVGYRRRNAQKGDSGGISARLIPALLSLTLTFLLATPVLAVLLVLFGAPLTTHNAHTVLCAAHLAILSATALIYVHGVDGSVWREVWAIARPADAVWGGAFGSCLGAWFGAVPIPLDWDRPWQAFPITIVTGAYIGFAVGSLLSRSSWLYGKRIQFDPDEDGQNQDKKSA